MGMKDDALSSYAAFYAAMGEALGIDITLPSSACDDAMLGKVAALRAEVARLTHDNLNYAVNVCPEQDRIIAKLTAAVTAFLEFCDVPQCDPEGPYNPDYGKHIFDLFKRAEDLAREATK